MLHKIDNFTYKIYNFSWFYKQVECTKKNEPDWVYIHEVFNSGSNRQIPVT